MFNLLINKIISTGAGVLSTELVLDDVIINSCTNNAPTPAPTSSGDAEQDAILKATNELLGYKSANAYNDPLLRDFLQKTVKNFKNITIILKLCVRK